MVENKVVIGILLAITFFVFAYEGKAEVSKIASVFLESYNQLDGIELVGGAFDPNQYNVQISSAGITRPIFDYQYKEKDNLVGWPSHFTIGINTGFYFSPSKLTKPVLISEAATKELMQYGISLDDIPSLNENPVFDSPLSIIQISSDGNIVQKNTDIYSVNSVTNNNNSVFVLYNETLNSSFFYGLLSGSHSVLFRAGKENDWNAIGPTSPNKVVSLLTADYFLLIGEIEDKSLLSLVRKHHQIYPDFQILAIKAGPKKNAFIYEGDLKAVTSWLESRPKAAVILEKKEDWIISKTIEIYNVDRFCVDVPVQIFPLTPKLNNHQLSEIRNNITLDTRLDEVEIMELVHYASRFSGVSNHILTIKDIAAMEVEIKFPHSDFKLKKVNNQWRISDCYEYMY